MMRLFFLLAVLFAAQPCWGAPPLKVALLEEHPQSSAWTELLARGLEEAKAKWGVQTEIIVMPPGPEQRELFRKASGEYDLVLVASDNLHEVLRDNAANFRRTRYGAIDAGIRAPNIMSITFADEQAAFLAGALGARHAGNPPIIGWLSGTDIPAMASLYNGYREGALLARPDCKIVQAVVGSFTDSALALNKARWLIEQGAKIIAVACGAAAPEVGALIRENGGSVIELDKVTSQVNFGAITKAADRAVLEIIESALVAFKGKEIVVYNLANQGVDFVPGPSVKANDDDMRRLKELRHELTDGGIRLRSLRRRTLCDCLD